MAVERKDRRVQRTRRMLQGALVQLLKERAYDDVTIQDIAERANLGRTTFYLHYRTKEDLLFDHHAHVLAHFHFGTFTRQALLGDAPQPELVEFLELVARNRPMYLTIRSAKDAAYLLGGIREQLAANLNRTLRTIFPHCEPLTPLDVLTEYIVGAQLALIHWWMTTRTLYDAVQLATMLHRLQRAAICDAFPSASISE